MKQYKHKDGKYIAEYRDMELRHEYQIFTISNGSNEGTLSSTFIEGSTDWEEIKEEDWKKNFLVDLVIQESLINLPLDKFTDVINKHLPRITDDMIENMREEFNPHYINGKDNFLRIIKQNIPKDLLANPIE